ncbi:MAG: choline kinase, partial [Erysipelotrichaceae bacterium]|nr:choline kinase [Erysipelotrichaceae bacterium]
GELAVQLSDWEYAGMQDTDVDIAMFCIYAMYEKEDVDKLIDIYYENNCPENIRTKIYCYVAACGLLWSNWCEFKSILGVEFGEYSLKQYRYGKDYYRYAKERM